MKRSTILYINSGVLAFILLSPRINISFANIWVEAGLLTTVGGANALRLPFLYDLGISVFNALALLGVLGVVTALCNGIGSFFAEESADDTDSGSAAGRPPFGDTNRRRP